MSFRSYSDAIAAVAAMAPLAPAPVGETIGRRIRRLARARDINQTQLAQACGIAQTAVSAWYVLGKMPRADKIPAIAAKLGVSISYIITGKEAVNG